ncbi:hypothetical protein ACI1MP_37165 (plasmid) [Kitasatospora griseola]|uniref:hypothetical protein n=1 Tax=Kitasatospora griseola TaxID=2064 RepID=UPI003855A72B
MDGAIWGTIGALGGAALTAAAGYLGPARAGHAERRRQADERQREQKTGELERLIAIRSAYRAWEDYLEQTASSYRALHETEETVRERISELRAAAQSATDAAMRDGWWIGSHHMPFELASLAVQRLVAGRTSTSPRSKLDEMRRTREALNKNILERLASLIDGVAVTRVFPPSE